MDDGLDIAIVGLSCRFPGARNPAEFWRNLSSGIESITSLSDEEILRSGVSQAHLASAHYVKAAPVLDDPGAFDAAFFGFTPSEARIMDPQHRILLELAFEALEDAGCDPARFPGRTGVFAGAAMNTYFMHAGLERNFAGDYIPTLIYNDKDFLSTRISYKLNLKGPSMTVQTACSTSLVAVHLARQSLLCEEIDLAVVGAVSVRVPHRAGYLADAGGVVSPDGHVRAFDCDANGTVFGSGGGVVVLKRLRDAVASRDAIYAVIKGSAVNNDGSAKAGYTAPSVDSQADAVVEALANADVEADSLSYIEAHGSGTPVGDPIEIRALSKAFRASTQRSAFCAIGSVKTNVGHLDAAAGMAGLIKTALALKHRQIPASLNFSRPNTEIDFPSTPFYVNTQLAPWTSTGPRRAGVMATGMGGTNAHLVLEEAPPIPVAPAAQGPQLFVLSARTDDALDATARQLSQYLDADPSTELRDAAFTLQTGRRAMLHRRFVVGSDSASLVSGLLAKPKRQSVGCVGDGARRPVVLLLSGVGDQYLGMGRELNPEFPAFREALDRCAEILRPHLEIDIRDVLYPKTRDWKQSPRDRGIDLKKMLGGNAQALEDDDTRRLNDVLFLQPVLFSVEYALASLWSDLGVVPQAIVGHSMGEYVAACLSGVFSLEDALCLIVRRTQLAASLPPASMLAVPLSEAETQALLPAPLSISLINGPNLCIVAGPPPAVDAFSHGLGARGIIVRSVRNTHAFHSRLLDPIVNAYELEVRKVRLNRPAIPFTSNVTGRWISDAEAMDSAYWSGHLSHTARFNDALHTLWQMDKPVLLEAGPGRTLGVLANQHPDRPDGEAVMAIPSLRDHYENQPDVEVLLNSVGKLWISGADIRWENLHLGKLPGKMSLPTYPFQRQTFWIEREEPVGDRGRAEPKAGLLKIDDWFHVPSWERTAGVDESPDIASNEGIFWVVFSDSRGIGHGFCEALAQSGAPVELIRFGELSCSGCLDRSDETGFEGCLRLVQRITDSRCSRVHIVHLGCVQDHAVNDLPIRGDALEYGFFSLMHLAQALGELNLGVPVIVAVVSNGLHSVVGDEVLDPSMAAVLGPCGVLPKEFPNIVSFNIDLPLGMAPHALSELHRRWILSEFSRPVAGDILAYRGSHRWRRKFVSVALPPAAELSPHEASPGRHRLRDRGVYLIAGGTGGIGLAVARHLFQACQARLVLTKKSPLPDRSQWSEAIENSKTPPELAQQLKQLLELETLGAEVEVLVADVTDREAMRCAFEAARRRFGALHGVIHAAGIVRAGLVRTKTRDLAQSVLEPKVAGAWVLHDLLEGAELDFLVLFSSITAVSTPFAESDYSGANAFLDAFAHFSRIKRSYPVFSINWPGWMEAGQLVNLKPAPGTEFWKETAMKKAILSRDGVDAFRRIIASPHPQVVVCPTDLDYEMRHSEPPHLLASIEASETEDSASDVESVVARIWSKAFGIPKIGLQERFADLGGHSLLALQIVGRVRSTYRLELTLREFFAAPTIVQLSSLIEEKLTLDIASLSDDEVRELLSAASAQTP